MNLAVLVEMAGVLKPLMTLKSELSVFHEGIMLGKCIDPKQPVIFKEKTELPCICIYVYLKFHIVKIYISLAADLSVPCLPGRPYNYMYMCIHVKLFTCTNLCTCTSYYNS